MIEMICSDLYEVFMMYSPDGWKISILAGTLFFIAAFSYRNFITLVKPAREKSSNGMTYWRIMARSILFFITVFYVYMVLSITLLSRQAGSMNVVNLHLGGTISGSLRSWIFIIENIMMLIPFGILYGLWTGEHGRLTVCLILGCAVSISIEYIQWYTGRGKAELDDVVMNGVGTLLGYCTFRISFLIATRSMRSRVYSGRKCK